MPILVFQHHPQETSARLGETLRDLGHRLITIKPYDGEPIPTDLDEVDGIVSMGGPMDVGDADHPWIEAECALIQRAHDAKIPVVGVCLGAQLIAHALGGSVGPMGEAEVGLGPVTAGFPGTVDVLHAGIPWTWNVMHMHGQEVTELPKGAVPLASSPGCKVQSFKAGMTTYGFQYHFEWRRDDIATVCEANRGWLNGLGSSPEQVMDGLGDGYDLHRQLGDKLCDHIGNLLFPIDKRLPSDGRPVENFRSIEAIR